MENKKTKTGLTIAAIVMAFILLAGVVGFVVYAAINQTFNIGGKVSFEAEGVEATVGSASWEGCTVNGLSVSDNDTLHDFTYSTTKDDDTSEDYLTTWQNLIFVITDTTDGTATISFDVTNNFTTEEDVTISVTIGDTVFGTGEDASTSNDNITIVADPNYATIGAGEYATFTITFTVDPSYNLDEITFTIPVSIDVVEETVTEDNGVIYTLSASGTAAVTGYSGSATSVEVASEVSGTDASAASLSLDSIVSAQSNSTYTVKIIAPNAFSGADSITTLTLPDSIEMIGADAFAGCENLTTLTNNSSVILAAGTYGILDTVEVSSFDLKIIFNIDYDAIALAECEFEFDFTVVSYLGNHGDEESISSSLVFSFYEGESDFYTSGTPASYTSYSNSTITTRRSSTRSTAILISYHSNVQGPCISVTSDSGIDETTSLFGGGSYYIDVSSSSLVYINVTVSSL